MHLNAAKIRPPCIIPAVRTLPDLEVALASPHEVLFLLTGTISNIAASVQAARERGKEIFVHFDLIEGLGKDAQGLGWLARNVRPRGILTTRTPLVSQARSLGLVAVQRLFLLDSQSVQTGMNLVRESKPDYIEVMPGTVYETLQEVVGRVPCPVIAGGLIKTAAHCQQAFAAGATAISTGSKELWQSTVTEVPKRPVR